MHCCNDRKEILQYLELSGEHHVGKNVRGKESRDEVSTLTLIPALYGFSAAMFWQSCVDFFPFMSQVSMFNK